MLCYNQRINLQFSGFPNIFGSLPQGCEFYFELPENIPRRNMCAEWAFDVYGSDSARW